MALNQRLAGSVVAAVFMYVLPRCGSSIQIFGEGMSCSELAYMTSFEASSTLPSMHSVSALIKDHSCGRKSFLTSFKVNK